MVSSMAMPKAMEATGVVTILREISSRPIMPSVIKMGMRLGTILISPILTERNSRVIITKVAIAAIRRLCFRPVMIGTKRLAQRMAVPVVYALAADVSGK